MSNLYTQIDNAQDNERAARNRLYLAEQHKQTADRTLAYAILALDECHNSDRAEWLATCWEQVHTLERTIKQERDTIDQERAIVSDLYAQLRHATGEAFARIMNS